MSEILLTFLAAGLGSWCYGYLFNVPIRILWPSSVAGAAAFLCVVFSGPYPFWGTAAGALLAGLVAYFLAPIMKVPVTPLIIPGIITLVPGISAYNAFMAALEGDYLGGLTGLTNVGAYTIAIAVGLSAAEQIYIFFRNRKRRF